MGRKVAGWLALQLSAVGGLFIFSWLLRVNSMHAAQQDRGRVGEQLTARGRVQDSSW